MQEHIIYIKSHESLSTNVVYDQGCILMRIWSNWSRSQSHFHERGTYLTQTWSICLTWIVLVMLCVLYVLLLVLIWDMEILVINSAFPFNCYCWIKRLFTLFVLTKKKETCTIFHSLKIQHSWAILYNILLIIIVYLITEYNFCYN